ncbi:ORF1 IS1 [Klebsiella pneumoniae subsp. ozaenae]|uniref:ORF1 IS1 n=1 Tax=Klebsiella pneumoniae subsp. ozaenae TaxID=574 RepID=A0A377ZBF4_KLEPO|nr:ORF1 IS1 [Klebsiella pneumoniae subsp. ozaenae]
MNGDFKVLAWLPFPSDVPLVQLPKASCVTVKALPDISAISALHCRKTWQISFTYTASQPGTHQKIIDMAMNGVGCRASARIMGVGLNTILRHLKNSGRSRKRTARAVLTGMCYSAGSAMRHGSSSLTPVDRPVCYNAKHMAKVAFWSHVIQFARPDQAVQLRSPAHHHGQSRRTGSFYEPRLTARRAFSAMLFVDFHPAIVRIVRQCRPLVKCVRERLRQL